MSAKHGIHKWSLMIRNKYGDQIHSTYAYSAELKASWLTCFTYLCSYVESICKLQ